MEKNQDDAVRWMTQIERGHLNAGGL